MQTMYPDQIFSSLPPTSPVSHSSIFSQVHTLFQTHSAHQAWQDECGVSVIHCEIIAV